MTLKPLRRRGLLLLLLAFPTPQARALSSGAEFLLEEPVARSAALGGACAAQSGSLDSLRYNPAGLAGLRSLNLGLGHDSAAGDWSEEWAGLAYPLENATLAVEALVSTLQPFALYDATGAAVGTASASNQNFGLGLARALRSWMSIGADARYFRSQLYTFSNQGYAFDLGARLGGPGWPLALGVAVQNFGAESAYLAVADPLPACLRAGAEADWQLDQDLRLHPSADLLMFQDPQRPMELRGGLEATMFQNAKIRVGLQKAGDLQTFSAGLGVVWDNFGLDYAYLPDQGLGTTQMITLSMASR
jgi:hypothetical protein